MYNKCAACATAVCMQAVTFARTKRHLYNDENPQKYSGSGSGRCACSESSTARNCTINNEIIRQ